MKHPKPAPVTDTRPDPVPAGKVDLPSEGREIELKFLLDAETFAELQQSDLLAGPKPAKAARRLVSTYFDTEAGSLQAAGIVLRVRRQRGGDLMTVKWAAPRPGSALERGELEVPVTGADPDPSLFGAEVAAELERVTGGLPLLARFTTDVRRRVSQVTAGAGRIEVAFDTGFIIAGSSRQPVRELELELKEGPAVELYRLASSLTGRFEMQLGVLTKSDRGMLLASGTHRPVVRATVPALAGRSVDEAIGIVIGGCLSHFIANWPAFDGPERTEAVHQMRVALRRLRAALGLFQRFFPCAEFAGFRAEAGRLASGMGEARNWDVFAGMVQDGPAKAFAGEPGFDRLMAGIEGQRKEGAEAVAALLQASATTRFVLAVQEFVARSLWRNAVAGDALGRLTEPAAGFAAECLQFLHRRVRKRGHGLLHLPPEQRHRVRIALKNLRYAADFFSDLFGHGVRPYAQAAAKLQDVLGSYNDTVMVADHIARLGRDERGMERAGGIVMGWYGHGAADHDAALAERWKRFRKAKRFWTGTGEPASA
jgi:triphosphatase